MCYRGERSPPAALLDFGAVTSCGADGADRRAMNSRASRHKRARRGPVNRRAGPVERHGGPWPQLVIGNRFQVVGLRQKQGEVGKLRLPPRQLRCTPQCLSGGVSCGAGGDPGAARTAKTRPRPVHHRPQIHSPSLGTGNPFRNLLNHDRFLRVVVSDDTTRSAGKGNGVHQT